MIIQQFSYSDRTIKKLALRKVFILLPLIIVILVSVFFIINKLENSTILVDSMKLYTIIGIFMFIIIAGSLKSKKKLEKILSETIYILSDNNLELKIPNGENIKIYFTEIRSFQKQRNGLILKSNNKQIKISNLISNFEILEKMLTQRTNTIIIYNDTKYHLNEDVKKYLAGTITVFALVGLIMVDDKFLKLYLGIPLLCGLLFSFIVVNKNIDAAVEVKKLLPKIIFLILGIMAYLIYQFI